MSSASGGFAPRLPLGSCPLTLLGDFHPSEPLIAHPWKKSCRRPWLFNVVLMAAEVTTVQQTRKCEHINFRTFVPDISLNLSLLSILAPFNFVILFTSCNNNTMCTVKYLIYDRQLTSSRLWWAHNSMSKWKSKYEHKNAKSSAVVEGECRYPKCSPKWYQDKVERWYSMVSPSRLAKKCKVYCKRILRKIIEIIATR